MNEPERPSEPVSLDEMMLRLRNQRKDSSESKFSESRETVTREDGSKVVRVKKRSKKKEEDKSEKIKKNNRILFFTTLVLCVLVFGGGFVFYLVQNARLNSGDYAQKLLSFVDEASGAKGDIEGYQKNISSLQAQRLRLEWPGQGIATSLVAQNLKGNIDGKSIFLGKLSGSELSAEKGLLLLDANPQHAGGPFGAALKKTISFNKFRCNDLDLQVSDDNERRFQVIGTSAELEFSGDSESRVFFQKGKLECPILGSLDISRGLLDFYSDRVTLSNLILTSGDGQIQLKGKLLGQNSGYGRLEFVTSQFPLQNLTQSKLERVVKTKLDSKNGFIELGRDGSQWRMQVSGNAQGFNLTALPVMSNIGILIDDSDLSATIFTNTTPFKLSVSPTDIHLSELVYERREVFKIIFNCHLDKENKLKGKVEVGISPRYVDREDFLTPEAFTKFSNGYRWASIDISGTYLDATDNSSQKFNLTADSRRRILKEQLISRQKRKALLEGKSISELEDEDADAADEPETETAPKKTTEPSAGQRFDELTQ